MKRRLLVLLTSMRAKPGRAGVVVAAVVVLGATFASGYLLGGRPGDEPAIHERSGSSGGDEIVEVWTCSMHPQIRQAKPGKCPICGMDLVPVAQDGGGAAGPRQIRLSEHARMLADVLSTPVGRADLTSEVRLVGKVDLDETSVGYITAWVPGRIDKLFIDTTGEEVKRGQSMASIYSPQLLLAQDELIQASKMARSMAGIGIEETLEASRERLRLWGLSKKQVEAIEKSGTRRTHLVLSAPMGGVVIQKNAFKGMYVEEGTKIFTIADLSRLWIMLDAHESDLSWIRLGQEVDLDVDAYPGQPFTGRVSFIDPVIDPTTRTARVRVEVDNEDGLLKPEMFVHARIESRIELPMAGGKPPLVIPATAPLITGKRAVVYVEVDADGGLYEGREIALGPRVGDHYVVLSGLEEGERVVVRGNFKIDSAMQILAKPSMMSPSGDTAAPVHGHGGPPDSVTDPPSKMIEAPAAFLDQLNPVFTAYLEIHDALASDDAGSARNAASELGTALDGVDMEILDGDAHVEWMKALGSLEGSLTDIRDADGIVRIRTAFAPLSDAVIYLARAFGTTGHTPLYLKHCPMALDNAGADWLQADPETRNPYFGSAMISCADDVELLGRGGTGQPDG
jgi:Cu(I)/Ag(I) efflux system membrane fusion protein